ncbi:MAG: chromosome segregation protein SMC [Clostridia bacterium]|nr:chromosome segregation protein SMC [Clostridia bacterium]
MFLKSLELQGFKSFPDKIKIEFGKGITAIVGPNGSGKSNVSDAIRWVLGEQSNKTLRSSKMEDVIFSGTTQRRPQGFAEVSLTIDNSDKELNIDYSEVAVSRRYYRSGESEYFINKTQTRLRDIHELFMDTGIGRDGYSIIGQGKIAEILSPKSEDRRQIIEEVAGISKYRYRKNEAQRKLDATEENLMRLGDIVGELAERLPSLEAQSNKAKKFLVMYDEKKSLEISLWIAEIEKIKESARDYEEKYNVAKGALEDITIEIDNLEKEITDIIEKNKDINVEIEQRRSALSGFEEKMSEISSRMAVLETGIRFETESIEKITEEISSAAKKAEEIKLAVCERNDAISKKTEEITTIEKKTGELYLEIESISKSGEDVRKEIAGIREQKFALSEQKNAINIQKVSHSASVTSKNTRKAELESELETRNASIKEVREEIAALEAELSEKQEQKTRAENSASGFRKMLEVKQKRYDEQRAALDNIQSEKQRTEQNLKILSDMEKHLEGFAGSVKTVLESSRHGTLGGIMGTVSQLIRVDKKYIVAVETALGNAIQDIVTKDAKSAKNAMLLLKNNRAGRATFLPLSEITPKPCNKNELTGSGIIGLAHELVSVSDERSKDAITFLLGRTIVCETIDDAINVSRSMKAKYKTVTLDGQVVNPGGSMTGGSTAKSAGLLSRSLEIERLEKLLSEQEAKLSEINASFVKSEEEKNELSARLDGVLSEIRVCDEEIHRTTDLRDSKQVIEKSFADLIEGCRAELDQTDADIKLSEQKISELDKEISELDKKIQKTDDVLLSLEGKTDEESARIEEIKQKISENDMSKMGIIKDIETERSVIEQLELQLSTFASDNKDKEERIALSRANIANNENGIAELSAQAAELENSQNEGKQKIAELIDLRNSLETEHTDFRTKQRESLNTKERLLQEVTRFENKLVNISEQTDRIVDHLMEYELTVTEAHKLASPIENMTDARKRVSELKNSIRALGNVSIESIEEYKAVKERFDFMDSQMNDLRKAKAELEKIIKELLWQMTNIFTEKFTLLNQEFGKIFAEMFGGGKAELILLDPEDVLNCGIDIRVAPPGKIIKNIVSLSGGEQSFTAIALYFAILKIRPTPFCMVDEIEAALDDVNVDKFASKLRDYCDNTQFIVITHRRGTMEEADVLYGVTMQEKGISKILTIDVNEMERQLKL